ncbi:MAG: DEAD/DEAH box helicase [Bacilli bacterium]
MNYKNFNDLGLSNTVLSSIESMGYSEPTKIQKEIIPLILNGFDCLGQAQTGTGKTLAYAASILSKSNINTNRVKALILTPTRELAIQVCEEFKVLNKSDNFNLLAVYGGSSVQDQIRTLKKGCDIVVGTPGRVIDLLDRKALNLNDLEFFVLDEADEMLNMGFLEDIKSIFKTTNEDKQVLLFSATIPKSIVELASKYMKKDYKNISIKEVSDTAINVSQTYYLVNEKMRSEALCRVLDNKSPKSSIIFCQKKSDVDTLLTELSKRNYSVEAMHGDIIQSMRIQTLERFKNKAFTYLIATDVAARGIHVDNIDLVVNYNLPQDVESYIHRVGRTGRAGKNGEAISFVTPREVRFLNDVEKQANCKIEYKELPLFKDVINSKYNNIINDVNRLKENKEYEDCMPYVRDMNKEDLIRFSASLLKMIFNKEIGSNFDQEIVIKKDRRDIVNGDTTRVFVTIGTMDGMKKGTLLDYLKDITKLDKDNFKNIEVLTKFTFMDIKNEVVDEAIEKIYNQKYKNHIIRIEKAKRK